MNSKYDKSCSPGCGGRTDIDFKEDTLKWDAWFASYTEYIVHHAMLCEATEGWAFFTEDDLLDPPRGKPPAVTVGASGKRGGGRRVWARDVQQHNARTEAREARDAARAEIVLKCEGSCSAV